MVPAWGRSTPWCPRRADEVGDGRRGVVGEQADPDVALGGVQGGVRGLGHGGAPRRSGGFAVGRVSVAILRSAPEVTDAPARERVGTRPSASCRRALTRRSDPCTSAVSRPQRSCARPGQGPRRPAQAKAADTAATLCEKAQTTLVPARRGRGQACPGQVPRRREARPGQRAVRRGGGQLPPPWRPAAGAHAALEEAGKRGRRSPARTWPSRRRRPRRRPRSTAREAADRARETVGKEKPKPKRHWFRRIVVALGLAAAARGRPASCAATTAASWCRRPRRPAVRARPPRALRCCGSCCRRPLPTRCRRRRGDRRQRRPVG